MTTIYTTIDSPIGELVLAGDESGALASLSVPGQTSIQPEWRRDPAAFADVERQLRGYFAGSSHHFDVPFAEHGSEFQQRVWRAIEAIPYGTTTTYGAVAEQVGAPRDRVPAVAAAIGANPLLILRPCHRVIGADGSLTGYAGGVERKQFLLTLEGALQPQLV